jgi:hypothetical protein
VIARSTPIFIGEKGYYLRFEIQDMGFLEDNFGTLMELFDPQKFGYKTAAKFLLVSCYDMDGEDYAHHFPQYQRALDDSMNMVREFCGQFIGPTQGLAFLYASIYSALVASGWFKAPEPKGPEPKAPSEKVADIKNSKPRKRTSKPRKAAPSGSAV